MSQDLSFVKQAVNKGFKSPLDWSWLPHFATIEVISLPKFKAADSSQSGERTVDLAKMVVCGEQIFDHAGGRVTRRSAANKPVKWTQVPLIVKLVKLCLMELQHQIDKQNQQAAFENTEEDDEYRQLAVFLFSLSN